MNKVMFWMLLVGLTSLVGCTTSPLQQLRTVQPSRYDAVDYYSWVILAPPDAVLQELARLEVTVDVPGAEESLVQMAVLISAMTTDPEQEMRALSLLNTFEERAATSPVESDYQAFAGLWRQVLELRLQSHSVDERIQALEHERRSLREQIEALTSIEQQLDRRGQSRDGLREPRTP
ncbi:MAG: hypothetical protein Q8L60_06850 [Gammaproteobacteria bacterium]|nr:hypothetical protein [Gammaproteobacteria bacterium]MDP2140336.1 hypothetical protein [Gammaproteobacteria bacterium]MDP2346147.1 hypothetical protein [Gammaproteobacteria bacterium]